MDKHAWGTIVSDTLAFTVGALLGRGMKISLWALSAIYFTVVALLYVIEFCILRIIQ